MWWTGHLSRMGEWREWPAPAFPTWKWNTEKGPKVYIWIPWRACTNSPHSISYLLESNIVIHVPWVEIIQQLVILTNCRNTMPFAIKGFLASPAIADSHQEVSRFQTQCLVTFKTILASWLSFYIAKGCKAMDRTRPLNQRDTDLN